MNKLIEKYKNMSEPVKASLWFMICGFFQNGMSMLITPLFTRIMTDTEYGRYSVYNSWYSILSIVVTLNLAAGVYTRGLIKYEDDKDSFSSSLLGLSTTSIILFLALYFAFHNVINKITGLNTYLMSMMFVEMWVVVSYQFWSNRQRVEYKYKKLVILTLVFVILRPLVSLFAVINADVMHQVEARTTGVILVNAILFTGLFITIFKKGKTFVNKNYWKYALLFNIPLIPHYLSQILLNQSDKIMINNICGSGQAGYYSVAYILAGAMGIFNSAVSATMNPWIYRNIKSKNYAVIGKSTTYILIAVAAMNYLIIAMAPELLGILAPSSYQQALWVIPPVTTGVYFSFLYNLFATFEFYFEKTWWVTTGTIICAGVNIILNMIFIRLFGFIAAGYTTLVCYILYALAHYYFMRKINKQFMDGAKVYNLGIILGIGLGLISLCAITMILYKYVILRYLLLLALIITAVIKRKIFIKLFTDLKK